MCIDGKDHMKIFINGCHQLVCVDMNKYNKLSDTVATGAHHYYFQWPEIFFPED